MEILLCPPFIWTPPPYVNPQVVGTVVPGATLKEKLAWLTSNAESNTEYTVIVDSYNLNSITSTYLSYPTKTGITVHLQAHKVPQTVNFSSNTPTNPLFKVAAGVTLVLDGMYKPVGSLLLG